MARRILSHEEGVARSQGFSWHGQNRLHRTITSAFQKAIQLMTQGLSSSDYAVAKRLAAGFVIDNTMARFISRHRDCAESDFVDLLIHDVGLPVPQDHLKRVGRPGAGWGLVGGGLVMSVETSEAGIAGALCSGR